MQKRLCGVVYAQLCANSWGDWWGEDGYFRIARGTDECGIESSVIGVTVDVINDAISFV